MLKKLSSTRLVVNHIEGVVHSHFFSFVQKESSQRAYRYRGASLEARRPQGGTSRQCPVIGIVPFAPPTCQQAVKARPTGHAPAEPLECGHEWMVWGTLPSLNNQVEERFEPPSRGPFRGCRSKASPTRPSVSKPLRKDVFYYCPTGVGP